MNASPCTFSRRELLLTALSAVAVAAMPNLAGAAPKGTQTDLLFVKLLGVFAEEILVLSPNTATSLGLDSGRRSALKSQFADVSPDGDAQWAGQVKSMLKRLDKIDRSKLSADGQIRHDAVRYAVNAGIDGIGFSYGGAASGFIGGTAPYPVSQQDGAVTWVAEFLDSQHQIVNAADAEAYLQRVAAMARILDQETARIEDQAGHGIMPPSFIAVPALLQLQEYRMTPAARQKLVTSITERTKKRGIVGEWQARATTLVDTLVYPALDRQIAAFAKATANAPDTAGVHRLPDGAAYYEWALQLGTTTTHTAAEIHAIGLEQNRQLQSTIDVILKGLGHGEGTVGQRLLALSNDTSRFYPDDDKGRAQLIAYCNEQVATIRTMMPKMSHLGLKAPLQIKRVPADIEAGAPLGYNSPGSLDGSRPAIYYINLKSTTLWPKAEISTLTAHEGIPGHTWQDAYIAEHHADIPVIASMIFFNAFAEGWALYAEQMVDELGLYVDDPYSRIGYLQAQQFRACRLVVDTGIHAMQWTRQQAIDFLVENTGRGVGAMTSEVDRYCVLPGQACGYKVGQNEILRQRERARAALGARFDLAAFNDAIVKSAGVPLTVLPTLIDRYIASVKNA